MKVVIDIPDEWKTRIEYNRRPNSIECGELIASLWKGKILPKEHGRLIDADAFVKRYEHDKGRQIYVDNFIFDLEMNALTIIEAESEVRE